MTMIEIIIVVLALLLRVFIAALVVIGVIAIVAPDSFFRVRKALLQRIRAVRFPQDQQLHHDTAPLPKDVDRHPEERR